MRQKAVPIVCAVFLVIAMAVQFFVTYSREKDDLVKQMEYKMEASKKDFIFELYDMHDATKMITHFFPEFENNEEELFAMLETVLKRYPDLYCCYVTYLPECSPKKGKWCCATAFRVNKDSVITYYDPEGSIIYSERDWYQGALKRKGTKGYWSLPYNDGTHEDPVFTYSQKVYNSEGELVGVAGSDYTLAWTKQLLEDAKLYDDAVCQLLNSDGTLIVGSGDTTEMHDMIRFEQVVEPTDMRLVLAIPKSHIRKSIAGVSLITFSVLLSGLLILGLLLNHIRKEHDALVRMETANKLMEKEMQIAHDIQMGMLPKKVESGEVERSSTDEGVNGLEVEADLIPMREVGGDLYDYMRSGDKLWFIIGDVSGKGVPAAMFMSAAVNLFRAAGAHSDTPGEIMGKMNKVLSANNPSLTFVTAFIGCLHVTTGELTYCNAGHCEPLIVESGEFRGERSLKVESLKVEPNIPIGYDWKYRFTEQRTQIKAGDTLVLYTDGITEARNEKREMLGMERWKSIVERSSRVESLLDEVKAFMGKAEQADDITLMTIRLNKQA